MLDQNKRGATEGTDASDKWHAQHHSITKSDVRQAMQVMDGVSTGGDSRETLALASVTRSDRVQEPADDPGSKTLEEARRILSEQKLTAGQEIAKAAKGAKFIIVDPPLAGVSDLPETLPKGSIMAVNVPDSLAPLFERFNNYDPKDPKCKPEDAQFIPRPEEMANASQQFKTALDQWQANLQGYPETLEFLQNLKKHGIKIVPIGRSDADVNVPRQRVVDVPGNRPVLVNEELPLESHAAEIKDKQRTENHRAEALWKLHQQYPDAVIVASLLDSGRKARGTKPEVKSAADLIGDKGAQVVTFASGSFAVDMEAQRAVAGGVTRPTSVPTHSADNRANAIGSLPSIDGGPNVLPLYDHAIFYPVAKSEE